MAWYDSIPITPYKKEYTHNLGFKPIVIGYVDLSTIDLGEEGWPSGWKPIPFDYSVFIYPEFYTGSVYFYHKDNNTVVFVAPKNAKIVADIFVDPQEGAWYE